MIEIMLEVEGRCITVKLKRGKEKDLRTEFQKMCLKDPVLKARTLTHYVTFKTFNTKFKRDVELDSEATVKDGQAVKVYFAPYAVNETGTGQAEPSTSSNSGSNRDMRDTSVTDEDEGDFMESIGLHRSTTPSTKRVVPLKDVTNQPSKTKTSRKDKERMENVEEIDDSDSEADDYYENAMQAKDTRMKLLQDLNLVQVPTLRTNTKKKSKPKDRTNNENRRVMPNRAVKFKNMAESTSQQTDSSTSENSGGLSLTPPDPRHLPVEQLSPKPVEQPSPKGPSGPSRSERVTKTKDGRRKPQKRRRMICETITHLTPLPEFSKDLLKSIQLGLVYVHQTHTQKMNSFLKKHIKDVTKDEYCTRKENKILKNQVINRLRSINAPNIELFQFRLLSSLSASLRNDRNYRDNKVPRKLAMKAAEKELNAATVEEEEEEEELEELDADSAEFILTMPVLNKETVMGAFQPSCKLRTKFMYTNSVKDCIEKYPYLKNIDLLLHDYSLRVPLPLNMIQGNFDDAIEPLALLLKKEVPSDDLQKIKLIESLDDYYREYQEIGDCYPCLQLWDALNSGADPLNNIPKDQAPALVIVVNDKELVSAIVAFDGECLYTLHKPTAFNCISLLLATYFVYQMAYPEPYEKLLYSLQHMLHGEGHVQHVVKGFFTKYNRVKKMISQRK